MQPARKIASNYLLTCEGLTPAPLVSIAPDGALLAIRQVEHPDREPLTEFYAGVLVIGLDAERFAQLATDHTTPLVELITPHLDPTRKNLLLISGLDYRRMVCTAQTRLQRL